MKSLVAAGFTILAMLVAPHASADPSGWCEWTPELDVTACGLIVGVPSSGQLISEPGDWSQPETRTK